MSPGERYQDALLGASLRIGLLSESAEWFVDAVAKRLHAGGIEVGELTIGQILAAIESEAEEVLGRRREARDAGGVL